LPNRRIWRIKQFCGVRPATEMEAARLLCGQRTESNYWCQDYFIKDADQRMPKHNDVLKAKGRYYAFFVMSQV
ncbi:hypothetical protein, partial [Paenibacillus dendritiformis]|uniref:hypothetical protein n=1 Tax=Paenibacillus dendritiformis TaxID=130049 RepID=UPI001B2FE4B1